MAQSAALFIVPTPRPADDAKETVQAAVPPFTQGLADLRVAERVGQALKASGYGDLSKIDVTVHSGLATLGGRVPSYYLKQVAQATARNVSGVRQICNKIEVV